METSSYLDELRAGWGAERLLRGLNLRFPGQVGPEIEQRVRAITDPARLESLLDLSYAAASLDDVRRALGG